MKLVRFQQVLNNGIQEEFSDIYINPDYIKCIESYTQDKTKIYMVHSDIVIEGDDDLITRDFFIVNKDIRKVVMELSQA